MPELIDELQRHANLRQRALQQMDAAETRGAQAMSPSMALAVLHKLASSPETATEALSLLHELQVYQVELALQDEELRASRRELETLLHRQRQLYDHSPAGSFTIDRSTVIAELNLAGARLLNLRREAALGRRLDAFLTDHDGRVLQSVLALTAAGQTVAQCELRLNAGLDPPKTIRVSVGIDPAGSRFCSRRLERPQREGSEAIPRAAGALRAGYGANCFIVFWAPPALRAASPAKYSL